MPSKSDGLRIVHEGSGAIAIPLGKWLVPATRTENPKKKQFELTIQHRNWIAAHADQKWIARAYQESFWQCLACGWIPWPLPRTRLWGQSCDPPPDDSIWEWFDRLHWRSRFRLLILARRIRTSERQLKYKPVFHDKFLTETRLASQCNARVSPTSKGYVVQKW